MLYGSPDVEVTGVLGEQLEVQGQVWHLSDVLSEWVGKLRHWV